MNSDLFFFFFVSGRLTSKSLKQFEKIYNARIFRNLEKFVWTEQRHLCFLVIVSISGFDINLKSL